MDCLRRKLHTVHLADRVEILHVEEGHRSLPVAEAHIRQVHRRTVEPEKGNPAVVHSLVARSPETGHSVALAVGSRGQEKKRN